MNDARLSRRTVLRGLGTALALPWLEAMGPLTGRAQGTLERAQATPRRMAFLYVPNGIHMPSWTPDNDGADFTLPGTLKGLESLKRELLVLTGLTQDNANAKGDGGGDHARALACFLTGMHPRKTDGANIKAGISVDQVAAQKVGERTRFSSLELGIDPSAQAGNCDSGYSCAYSSNISWSSESTPVAHETNPRAVFDRLFGAGDQADRASARAKRTALRQSILDVVNEDARQLRGRLGATDSRKLDEYLTGVRELERRIVQSMQPPPQIPQGAERPSGVPSEYGEHIRLMCDMIALAFQADLTRIVTFVLANEGSNRSYGWLDVPEGHHELSHHENNAEKQAKIAKINTFHVEQLAYLLEKLKSTQEENVSVLDNSMVVFGSGIGDGNRHNHDDLPIVLAGRCTGTIQTGRHVRYPNNTPLNNLFLSMLDRMECRTDVLGDSSGALALE
jgi:hypothetical protein